MPTPAANARKRPFRVLPPITRGTESLDGAPVLEEVPGDAGVLLWQSLRNVMLWTGADAAARKSLFSAEAARRRAEMLRAVPLPEELAEPLAAVAALLAAPTAAKAAQVSAACTRIAGWAEGAGAPATALAFAQAAALAEPERAGLAWAVGRLARRRGEIVRAEGWYHRAIMLARQSRDWRSYALAFNGLGNAKLQRGNIPAARRNHTRALRAARRHALRDIEAGALHDLFRTALELGDAAEVDAFAAQALRAYGEGHPRVAVLAHDVAVAWVARGEHARALPVLEAAAPHLKVAGERALALASVARAAGGAGRADRFRHAALEAVQLLLTPGAAAAAPQVYLTIARGALLLGDAEHAGAAAREAERLADESGEAKIVASAGEILASLRTGGAPPRGRAPAGVDLDAPGELAGELVRSLEVAGAYA